MKTAVRVFLMAVVSANFTGVQAGEIYTSHGGGAKLGTIDTVTGLGSHVGSLGLPGFPTVANTATFDFNELGTLFTIVVLAGLIGILIHKGNYIRNDRFLRRFRKKAMLMSNLIRWTLVVSVSVTLSNCPTVFAALPSGRFVDAMPVLGANSLGAEMFPVISTDGLELFFNLDRDIYVASRPGDRVPFDSVKKLGSDVNTGFFDAPGGISSDGLILYFGSGPTETISRFDMYQATREDRDSPFGNVSSLGDGVNTATTQNQPFVVSDGTTVYYHSTASNSAVDEQRLWMATRSDPSQDFFDNAVDLGDAVNGTTNHADAWKPTVSSDGLTLFFSDFSETGFGPARRGGKGGSDIWVSYRESITDTFPEPVNLNDLWPGSTVNTRYVEALAYISRDWPADGSKLYFSSNQPGTSGSRDIWQSTWMKEPSSAVGDFNGDGEFTIQDLEALTSAIQSADTVELFDLDRSGTVDSLDLRHWITELRQTWIGDANLDGIFDSGDMVSVFQAGEYEDDVARNSSWETGDWNGDGEFDSGDLVVAFQDGGYEQGARSAVNAVPEPSSATILAIGVLALYRRRQSL